jgi:TolB-like protein
MRINNWFQRIWILIAFLSVLTIGKAEAAKQEKEWYEYYQDGLDLMNKNNWQAASENFKKAIAIEDKEAKKVKTYGMHFIEYYPHRELGICFYNLGDMENARAMLGLSNQQQPSARATEYINKISGGVAPPSIAKAIIPAVTVTTPVAPSKSSTDLLIGSHPTREVGDRMRLAVFPFASKGATNDLGETVLDKMITAFVNMNRFRVVERAQLEKILQEQQLGMTGAIDVSTAAEIGKANGVDGIVLGTVTRDQAGALTIDARMVDTETASIITARDAYTPNSDFPSVKQAVAQLTLQMGIDLPLLDGYIISVDGERMILSIGKNAGVKRGVKCIVYREGKELRDPVTNEVIARETQEIGEVLITQVFDRYSEAKLLKLKGSDQIVMKDLFITK